LKLKEDNAPLAYFESLMEDEPSLLEELVPLAFNIRKELCNVLKTYEEKIIHNMVFLMLDIRLKSLHIVSSFVGRDQGVVV
jgi:hypothetical protein